MHMRIPCRPAAPGRLQRTLTALCCLWAACSPAAPPDPGEGAAEAPYPDPAAQAVADAAQGPDAPQELLVRARTAAARLRTDATVEELEPLGEEMRLCVQALTLLDGAPDFPWGDWIEEDRGITPHLGAELLRAADHVVSAEEAMRLARGCDQRETGLPLRLQAHRVMWRHDPPFAVARARLALFREQPRADDRFRPALLEELLLPRHDPAVDNLLLDVAALDTMESRARRLALNALPDREVPGAAAICESIFDTEATDLMVRQQALRAIVALDRERARRVLDEKLPDPGVEPILHAFMVDMRAHLDESEDA